ncbi:MAG: DUF4176 domain-containing protein [Coriobacteriales bacterium]|nr:DUF4176 domain-containing protein [Coriobacteriales bacterium]
MYERLLPLGSVVLLKGANKRVMITGRIQVRTGEKKVYDYSACWYPEGITSPQEMFFFDHDAIEMLYFVGFQDEEEIRFRNDTLGALGELYVDESGRIAQRE